MNPLNFDIHTDRIYKALYKTNPKAARAYKDGALRRRECMTPINKELSLGGDKWIISESEKYHSSHRRRTNK